MKIEFDLNVMGLVYLFIAVGLVLAVVVAVVDSVSISRFSLSNPVYASMFAASIVGGVVALGLLVPVIRRLVRAFMPSA
jgi:hypothetical protein